jgi:hypothetical protein
MPGRTDHRQVGRRSTALATTINYSAWADYLEHPALVAAFLVRLGDDAVTLKLTGHS